MPKKVTDLEKKEILNAFHGGLDIKEISKRFNYSSITITNQLKKILGSEVFKDIKKSNSNKLEISDHKNKNPEKQKNKIDSLSLEKKTTNNNFYEIVPLSTDIETFKGKDFASEPIANANFPSVVYLIIDKKIELEPKLLRDYTKWNFLSEVDLNRKVIEIFSDQKTASKNCSRNQKLIKINNPNIFVLTAHFLKAKGITRIIFDDSLLSL